MSQQFVVEVRSRLQTIEAQLEEIQKELIRIERLAAVSRPRPRGRPPKVAKEQPKA